MKRLSKQAIQELNDLKDIHSWLSSGKIERLEEMAKRLNGCFFGLVFKVEPDAGSPKSGVLRMYGRVPTDTTKRELLCKHGRGEITLSGPEAHNITR